MNINIPVGLTQRVSRAALIVSKHSPQILFGAGVVGVVATAVFTAKATLKVEDVLDTHQRQMDDINDHPVDEQYTERDKTQDKAVVYTLTTMKLVKLYAAPVALGVLSIGSLTGSHIILTKRNVALTAAYKAVENSYNEYKKRVENELGPEKAKELREFETETVENSKGKSKQIKTANPHLSPYARIFDQLNPAWEPNFETNRFWLECQQNYLNDKLHANGHVFLNEVYDTLRLPRSKAGAVVGWVRDNGDNFIDFGITDISRESSRNFINGNSDSIILDFNVDGLIFELIEGYKKNL